ncbi:hypothetical protein K1719_024713 [Acacia pycnantha]|nr:hypothetical protein K1719_024713 [Acacia pycnantha]
MAGSQMSGEAQVGGENTNQNKRFGEIEEEIDDLERAFENLENFEILKDAPQDHSFLSKKTSNRRPNLIETMKAEWEVLKLCLAGTSIYVRAYEERPDLMRAIVVGPEETPYHLALLCFDIRFTSKYPTIPPEFSYRSYDNHNHPSSQNPNSNTNAELKHFFNLKMKSCSTPMKILQLLTLTQTCFLVHKSNQTLRVPSGRQGPDTTEMKQTWEAMLCMLKSPPQNFETFVPGYFRTRAHQILMNYKSHIRLDETTIGLFYRLVRAFEDNGTYCKHHCNEEYFDLLRLQVTLPLPRQKSANSGYFCNLIQ